MKCVPFFQFCTPKFAQIHKYFVLSCDCMIAAFRNPAFVEISSKHLHSQSIRSKELNILGNVHLPPCVTFHMSCAHVLCHISHVTCKISMYSNFRPFSAIPRHSSPQVSTSCNSPNLPAPKLKSRIQMVEPYARLA